MKNPPVKIPSVDDEPEILEGPTLDDKLDTIIDLLKQQQEKDAEEHEEIKNRLTRIETNLDLLEVAYQQHGKALGEIMAQVNGHFGEKP
jgi:hypothetical protein